MKKTKIVATIGPASNNKETLRAMIEAGMNVARLNFSHGTYESHKMVIDMIRELSVEMKHPIGILADLQGPRIRVGNNEPFEMENGEIISISDKKTSKEKELIIDSDGVSSALEIGERILIEDGLMALEVVEKNESGVAAKVVNGGTIKPRKGINVPDTKLSFGAVTEKDERDLEFSVMENVDFVALSFVSNGREILETREKIKKILGRENDLPQIVSKIERKEAIKNLDEIVEAADGVMVARGDLGIEMDESKVVIYQKEIIAKCREKIKPVIVATQMLDSMIRNPIPTRAEVADVTNAVIDHTDAVMLSGESANGEYPIKAVAMMNQIIRNTEESPFDDVNFGIASGAKNLLTCDYDSIINSAHDLAGGTNAKAIMIFSRLGYTARRMSNLRPDQMLVIATNNEKTYQQLSIVWGVRAYYFPENVSRNAFVESIIRKAQEDGRINEGDKAVVILGQEKNLMSIGLREI